jgi:hypothetical protein
LPLQPDDNFTSLRAVAQGSGDYVATYHWLHLDTQKTGETTNKFLSRRHFLELLDHWNADHRWKYWSKPS